MQRIGVWTGIVMLVLALFFGYLGITQIAGDVKCGRQTMAPNDVCVDQTVTGAVSRTYAEQRDNQRTWGYVGLALTAVLAAGGLFFLTKGRVRRGAPLP
ncbi:MAG: hypothetical protein ACRDT4_14595 [Micromonosporaceae bacterium]